MRRWLLALALLASATAQAELRLQLDTRELSPAEVQASQALIDQASNHLPPSFIARLDRQVRVRWRDDLPEAVYGRLVRPATLQLNRRLLPQLLNPAQADAPTTRAHGSLRRELQATMLHELTHLYDRARLWSPEQHRLLQRCSLEEKTLGLVGQSAGCRGQSARRFSLSDDPQLLDLAGWPQAVGTRGEREHDNGQVARSPDPYELSSPLEFVAVNMEYFLLDPSYACRRPTLHAYLSAHFAWQPAQQISCDPALPYLNAGSDFARLPLGRLDPERVYEVDYLLAEANQQWASRWGHSMLRLVICAPGRPRGPACRLDLDQHLVLSYRAFVGDVQLSSWDGLTGAYPSRLFILPLAQVIEEYTKVELRSLASVPLTLSRADIERLTTRAVEQHWSYDGDYWFLSNNCAVETLKLLRSGSERGELQSLDSIMPNGLLELLDGRGLVDRSVLDDPREALRLGYRFDSFRERYQAMFDVLRQRLPVPQQQVEQWLDQPALQRREWIERADLRAAAAMLLLEQASLRRQMLQAQEQLKQRYLNARESGNGQGFAEADATLREILANSGFLSRPAELLDAGYGLPQAGESQSLEADSQQRQQRLRQLNDDLQAEVRQLLAPELLAEIEAGETNLKRLGEHLRQLHKAGGGLQL